MMFAVLTPNLGETIICFSCHFFANTQKDGCSSFSPFLAAISGTVIIFLWISHVYVGWRTWHRCRVVQRLWLIRKAHAHLKMPSLSPSSIRRRYQSPFPKSNLKCLYPIVIAFIALHFFWICYDEYITSRQRFRPKRKPVRVTESSPLSPFYSSPMHNEYNGSIIFPVYNNSFPCGQLMDEAAIRTRADAKEGLFYVKEIETSSTIFSSITARIARNMGQRQQQQQQRLHSGVVDGNTNNVTGTVCSTRVVSQRARRFRGRSLQKSFLWSVVAEPVDRLIAKYYHYADIKQPVANDKRQITTKFQDYVLNNENQDYGYYFRSLSVKQNLNPYNMKRQPYIRELLDSYDFLGISERMDESLAVLMILLGLEIQDVLYLPTPKASPKDSSSGSSSTIDYYENWKKDQCRPILVPEVTLEMKQWFYSEEFEAFIEADVLFYKAVNKSLDATIDNLGKQRVEKAVKQLQMAQSQVEKMCQNVRFPCSSEGEFQKETDCFFSNIGCGYECLDNVGQSLKNLD
jgi:hypothetical protein